MRVYVGSHVENRPVVMVVDRPVRPDPAEVGELLAELRDLNAASMLRGHSDAQVVKLEAAYMARKHDLLNRIEVSERFVAPEPLPHHPRDSVVAPVWGREGPGSLDLSRSLLAVEMGDSPPAALYVKFAEDVVARLPSERFELSAEAIQGWLGRHRHLVAAEPVTETHAEGRSRLRVVRDTPLAATRVRDLDSGPSANGTAGQDDAADPGPVDDVGSARASAVVAACEAAWTAIQLEHPEVPDAVMILGSGVERGRLVKLGHWWGGRWLADGNVRGEVLLAGEALHLPPEQVFEVLLHESAHGLCAARAVKDTSRGGRYHNARFQAAATEVGLTVGQMRPYGWARTAVSPAASERYAGAIAGISEAMRIVRQLESGVQIGSDEGVSVQNDGEGRGRDGRGRDGRGGSRDSQARQKPASCGCRRKLRMAPSVLAAGPVLCGLCGSEFTTTRQAEHDAEMNATGRSNLGGVGDRSSHRDRSMVEPETASGGRSLVERVETRGTRLAGVLDVAHEAIADGAPALVALHQRQDLLQALAPAGWAGRSGATSNGPVVDLTSAELEGIATLVAAGYSRGDEAIVAWYAAFSTYDEVPMLSGSVAETERRNLLARSLLKADGTLVGPAVEIGLLGRELMAGDRVVVTTGHADDLPTGVPGIVERVDPAGSWLEVDFATDGRHRLAADSMEAATLDYAYTVQPEGADWVDARAIDIEAALEAELVRQVPEIEL